VGNPFESNPRANFPLKKWLTNGVDLPIAPVNLQKTRAIKGIFQSWWPGMDLPPACHAQQGGQNV
jgi:hypothetical protein